MVNRKSVVWLVALSLVGLFGQSVLAYEDATTHRAITNESIKVFEHYYPDHQFLEFERRLIIQGSQDEDQAPRWLNHFYDPIHNRGFKGFRSSKDWAQNVNAQAGRLVGSLTGEFFGDPYDFSWPRAIYEYAWGDRERALLSLGHVLHLAQDATVPDHTRDDAHVIKKTFEGYAGRFTVANFNLSDRLILTGKKPIILGSLDDYFDTLASFSNGNFFSDDTILDDYFGGPKIIKEKKIETPSKIQIFGYGGLSDVKIAYISKKLNRSGYIENRYSLKDENDLVVSDYWTHLSEKAVLGSAGVIKLFFEEVEKEKKTKELFNLNKNFVEKLLDKISFGAKNTLSALGTLWAVGLEPSGKDDISEISPSEEGEDLSRLSLPEVFDQNDQTSPTISQTEIDRLMSEVLSLQKQLADLRAGLENESLSSPLVDQVIFSGTQVYRSVSSSVASTTADTNLLIEDDEVFILPPTILLPNDFSIPFATTTIVFSGTTSPGLVVFSDFGHENIATSSLETGEWSLEIFGLPEGTSTVSFFARDGHGHISEVAEVEIFIDSLPPIVTISIAECVESFLSDVCLVTPKDELNISWQVNKGINYTYELIQTYEFVDEWGEDLNIVLASTTETSLVYKTKLPNHLPIGWKLVVMARDSDGVKIYSAPFEIWFHRWPLTINEIGWTGTLASSSDEWLEIYNSLPFDIDLTDFYLIGKNNQPLVELNGTISGQDFYLIERGDDLAISNLLANLVSSFGVEASAEGLPDNGLQLTLIKKVGDEDVIWDKTVLFELPYYWPSGSIERMDWDLDGGLQSNWCDSNSDILQNGLDRNGEKIRGTPKMENSTKVPVLM